MAISREFAEMMRETITVQPQSALNKYGKPSWGTAVTYPCRIMGEQRILRDKEGREIVEQGRAIIYGSAPSVTVKDRLLLPGGIEALVTSVDQIGDETGAHHTVIGYG